MADAWGGSFGTSWGSSFGSGVAPTVPATAATGFNVLRDLMNTAWQNSPVTQDAFYKGVTHVRVEVLRFQTDDFGVNEVELRAVGLLADFDADTIVGDSLTVEGVAYTIVEVRPLENIRVELLLRR